MHKILQGTLLLGLLAASVAAQSITLPQQAATTEGNSASPFPFNAGSSASGAVRVQNIYAASNFISQGVNQPILINQIRWRANALAIAPASTFPNVEVKLSTAPAGAVNGPSGTFANNLTNDARTVFPSGPLTLTPTAGTTPNGFLASININPPFLYVPAWGDLCIDVSNQGATGIAGAPIDLLTNAGASGGRVYDTTPNATVITPTTGQSQPGVSTVVNLGYTLAVGTLATNTSNGQGCGRQTNSFYENFASAAAMDLSNRAMTLTPLGNGAYTVSATGAFLPVGSISTPQALALMDDSSVTVPLTAMGSFPAPTGATSNFTICSNGWVSPLAGNSVVAGGTNGLVLNAPQTIWCCWHDYDPTIVGAGQVQFEESAALTMVTWDAVRNWGGTTAADDSTFQMQFYPSGVVVIVWQTMALTGNNYVVGYSPAGPSLDPGSSDLSALLTAGGFTTNPIDNERLALAANSRPVINTNWNFTLSNIPPTGVLGVDILGLSNPAVPDLAFLGMPGCGLFSSLDLLSVWPVPGVTRSWSLPIPNNAAFINVNLFMSNAVFQVPPLNSFGATTSNGIGGTCGDL